MKNIMKSIKKFFQLILIISIFSCEGLFGRIGEDKTPSEQKGKRITILSWNVQNIFDDVYDGTEYWEFNPNNENWNTHLFHQRLSGVQKVVEDVTLGGPDILLFTEIENRNVIDVLNNDFLLASCYKYTYTTALPGSSIQLAILSRFPIISLGFHSPGRFDGRDLRPVLEIQLKLKTKDKGTSETMYIFLNHWKSKLGGVAETEPARIAASELLSWRISRILTANPSALVVAAGDFNASPSPDFFPVNPKESLCSYSLENGERFDDIVFISPDREICGLLNEDLVLYSPWESSGLSGSYCYKGSWERIDNFLFSSAFLDKKGWDLNTFSTFTPDYLQNSYQTPFRWNSRKQEGYSDHYPLFAEFVFFK